MRERRCQCLPSLEIGIKKSGLTKGFGMTFGNYAKFWVLLGDRKRKLSRRFMENEVDTGGVWRGHRHLSCYFGGFSPDLLLSRQKE